MAHDHNVTVTCQNPDCGRDVSVSLSAITLMICVDDLDKSIFYFTCPRCAVLSTCKAINEAISILMAHGVKPIMFEGDQPEPAPVEPQIPQPAAITHDDVLDFMLDLDRAGDMLSPLALEKA